RQTWTDNKEKLNWQLVSNSVDYEMLCYFYRGMPPANQERIEEINDSICKRYRSCFIKRKSIEYGKLIAQEIIEWSKTDGGDKSFEDNYPESFAPPKGISKWTKTTPGYLPSLLPYWGNNRPFLKGSAAETADCKVFEFSIDSSSFMYKEALLVLENSKLTDPKYEAIAEYWDDGAGYSGTPSGHFFTMAMQLTKKENVPLDKSLELYVKLGVAVNEAFIEAFKLKYTYNLIRPISYIQRYIDPQFNTRIASPPFPEFPSGHSFQSGAATEVMKSVFGDEIEIIDSTHVGRTDIDGSPRRYSSLTEMSEEISISRLYGGIHFKETLDLSLSFGRKIGRFVSNTLNCRK
ncbi:MAG: vanadium-dependent haloperoxidase, partial [Crocinitomicaceae bacterium]